MEYSKIKTIQVKNFRNIGEVKLSFEESPIIALVGGNEAGKTSIVKALAATCLHAYSRYQNKFIRTGTNGFGVCIVLEDDTQITRIKTGAANTYIVEGPGLEKQSYDKLEGLPKIVADKLGLIEEPETKEYLHIRTYEDQLLFASTSGSTNYKVMYNALKVEQLTKAISIGSTRVNAIKARISNNEHGTEALQNTLRSIRIIDIEPLMLIKNQITSRLAGIKAMEEVKTLINKVEDIHKKEGILTELESLSELDTTGYKLLNNIYNNKIRLDYINKCLWSTDDIETIEKIDISVLQKLKDINKAVDRLEIIKKELKKYDEIEGIEKIGKGESGIVELGSSLLSKLIKYEDIKTELSRFDTIPEPIGEVDLKMISISNNILNYVNKINNNDIEEKRLENEMSSISNQLKELGARITSCPNCGESIVVEV